MWKSADDEHPYDTTNDNKSRPSLRRQNKFLRIRRHHRGLVRHHRTGSRDKRPSFEEPTRRRCSSVQTTPRQRNVERPHWRCELLQKIRTTSFHQGCTNCFLVQVHAVLETQQRYYGLATMDDQISTHCKQTHWVLDGFDTWFGSYSSRCDCSNCSTTVLNHMLSYLGMMKCPDKYLYNSTMQEDSNKGHYSPWVTICQHWFL